MIKKYSYLIMFIIVFGGFAYKVDEVVIAKDKEIKEYNDSLNFWKDKHNTQANINLIMRGKMCRRDARNLQADSSYLLLIDKIN